MDYCVVKCGGAYIRGERIEGGCAFKGIRYATARRFEKPVEATLEGDIDATRFGKCCPQKRAYMDEAQAKDPFYYNEFRKGSRFEYGEDCLHLNIYAPLDEGGKRPVVLFVHGGSFTGGSSDEKQLDGSAFMQKGAVFVSINYRLNIFGFYAGGDCKGNYGLYDVACALDFVRKHIADFGGDPDNVTLMGQSAGAMLITTLISSGMAEGKAKRAILMSGGGVRRLLMPLKKPNKKFWDGIAAELEGDIATVSAEELFKAWAAKGGMASLSATAPVIDGDGVKDSDYGAHTLPCIMGMVGKDLLPPVLKKMRYRYAKLLAKRGAGCYAYDFLHPLPGDDRGTFHSADLWYALGSLARSDRPFEEEDYAISDEMLDRFVAFATTGEPNIEGKAQWRTYKAAGDIWRIQ